MTIAIHAPIPVAVVLRLLPSLLVLLLLLDLCRGQDTVIVLGMLKIVFGGHAVALGIRVPGELEILLVNMRGGTANFHLWTARVEGPVRVVVLLAAMGILRPAAALP